MACEEMKVVEEYKEGTKQRVGRTSKMNMKRERKGPRKISKSGSISKKR